MTDNFPGERKYMPWHTKSCREHWGCGPSCEVLAMWREHRDLNWKIQELTKTATKKRVSELLDRIYELEIKVYGHASHG